MKKTGTAAMVFPLARLCIGLLLISGLAYPTAAGAQAQGKDDVPEQLWQIYPLDPTKTDAGAPQTAQPQPPPPGPQTHTDSAVQTTSESPRAQAQPSEDSDSGRSLAFPLLAAFLGLLVGVLVVAAARNGAFAIAGEYLARGGSALESPLRAATNAPRYVGRGSATVVSPLRTLPRLARRIGHLLLWPLRASAGIRTYVVRRVASAGAAARQASRMVLHAWRAWRFRLLFYALTVVVSATVGLLVTLLLQP
jgi:hypothetical protein